MSRLFFNWNFPASMCHESDDATVNDWLGAEARVTPQSSGIKCVEPFKADRNDDPADDWIAL